jgi:hypothetical protein
MGAGKMKHRLAGLVVAVAATAFGASASRAQSGKGSGAPTDVFVKAPSGFQGGGNTPTFAGPPAGMTALKTDLFTSKNFYDQKENWLDQRYYRCNTVRQLVVLYQSGRIGTKAPMSAAWGDCKQDAVRAQIVSPYPYKTAKEHYDALLARAKAHGGPTVYTRANLPPDWDGYYDLAKTRDKVGDWVGGEWPQVTTILSLLTPEYQRRMVQAVYHETVDNSPQWVSSLCEPEGYTRWWNRYAAGGNFQLTMTPYMVQFLSGNPTTIFRQFAVGQTKHVLPNPQWLGETVAFWDGTTLVAWTANVEPWTIEQSMFENSDKLEGVETFKPILDAKGAFVGLETEAILYDPEAFAQPLRVATTYDRLRLPSDQNFRYAYQFCEGNVANRNGRTTHLSPDDPNLIDYHSRPWAKNWEKWFEQGWKKPETQAAPSDVLDLFK